MYFRRSPGRGSITSSHIDDFTLGSLNSLGHLFNRHYMISFINICLLVESIEHIKHLLFFFVFDLAPESPISKRLFHAEKHGAHLSEPIRVNSGHAMHVLFGSHDEFVVHHIVRSVSKTEERRAGVEFAGETLVSWRLPLLRLT